MSAAVEAAAHSFDVESVRQDFPILQQSFKGQPLVYLDNAATSQKPQCVIDAISRYYQQHNANVHRGVHRLSELATQAYEQARKTIAQHIGARRTRELIFTRGTTEAINLVAQSYGQRWQAGDELLISEMEHHSNIVPWQLLAQQRGLQIRVIPITDQGELDMTAYAESFTDKTRLVAVGHVSNALGTVNPLAEIIRIAHDHGAKVMVDGAQAIPHMAVDVQALDCDFYAFSGHKAFGPTGIGVLYGKEALLETMPPYQGGGDMIRYVSFANTEYSELPYKFEAGTPNIAGAIGFGVALEYIGRLGMAAIEHYEQALLTYATERAQAMPHLRLIGTAAHKAGVLSFLLESVHAHDVGTIVDTHGVAIRTGHHCAMPVMQRFKVPATARASFAFYNTFAEIDALFNALEHVEEVFA